MDKISHPPTTYTCPMHHEIRQDKPGRCPICGMALVKEEGRTEFAAHHQPATTESYRPLIIIALLLLAVTVAISIRQALTGNFSWVGSMAVFMAGFFLVFSGFKLLDIKGFAEGYSTYDLLAKHWFSYGFVYPFLELGLGLAYILIPRELTLHLITAILMTFSGIGVAIKLARHERFQCACLGTFLKVPLTKVTLMEDFGMAAMAILMLLT